MYTYPNVRNEFLVKAIGSCTMVIHLHWCIRLCRKDNNRASRI